MEEEVKKYFTAFLKAEIEKHGSKVSQVTLRLHVEQFFKGNLVLYYNPETNSVILEER